VYSGFRVSEISDRKRGIFLFFISLSLYLLIALFVNQNYIGSDGRSYQRMAVNIAEGRGFSNSVNPPYEKVFFREPGYPFFFSLACSINVIIGNSNHLLPYADPTPGYYGSGHTEILILRILQAVLASVIVLFLYKILLLVLKPKLAFLIPLLFIFYFPFSIYITFPHREILETAILTLLSWFFLKSATGRKPILYDILFGLFSAGLVMTLQAYFFILPFFLLSHLIITRSIRKTLISTLVIAAVFLIGILPWSLRAYNTTKDIRVFKTFGISYTYEYRKFHEANAKAFRLNLDGEGEKYKDRIVASYQEPGEIMFHKSFNGTYTNYADSLNKVIQPHISGSYKDHLKSLITLQLNNNFRKALIWPLWKTDYRKSLSILKEENKFSVIAAITAGILVSLLFLWGLINFGLKSWYFFPVFVFHLVMIPVLADEARRMVPFIPWYFMYFVLAIYLLEKIIVRKRLKAKSIREIKSDNSPFKSVLVKK